MSIKVNLKVINCRIIEFKIELDKMKANWTGNMFVSLQGSQNFPPVSTNFPSVWHISHISLFFQSKSQNFPEKKSKKKRCKEPPDAYFNFFQVWQWIYPSEVKINWPDSSVDEYNLRGRNLWHAARIKIVSCKSIGGESLYSCTFIINVSHNF